MRGGAALNQTGGSAGDTISAPLTLNDPLTITNNSGTKPLMISNTMTNGANLLTVAGAGNTVITGAVTGSGGVTKTGAGSLTLNNAGNAISGTFTLGTTGSSFVTIVNTLATDISTSSIGQDLSVTTNTAGGDITDSGVIAVGGTSNLTTSAANDDIILNNNNSYTGAVSMSTNGASGNILLNNAQIALDLGTVTAGGTLAIETDNGSITDSGVITAGNTSSFTTSTANNDITLDSNNSYTGAVSMATNGLTGNISLTNAQIALDLGTVTTTAGGTLAIETDSGSITDSGVITASGTSSFTTTTDGNDIILDQVSSFTGAVSLNTNAAAGSDASITNTAIALDLGTSAIGGDLTVETNAGNITDSGVLTVGENSSFTTSKANEDITLSQVNLFTGAVSLATNGATGNISVTNVGQALDLGAVTTTAGGTLAIETDNGSITDSGVITASGTSSFTTTTDGDDITLNSGLAASGAITLSTAGTTGNATVVNTVATTLAASTIGGNLDVNSSNNSLTVAGAVSTAAANGSLTLDAGTNTLTTNVGGTIASGSGATTLTAANIDLNENVTTVGGLVDLNATTTVDIVAAKSITTTGTANTGVASGAIDTDVSGNGTVNIVGSLITTGAAHNAATASAGGDVTIDTEGGAIAVGVITTTGGAATAGDNNGGDAGAITLNTGGQTITLNGDLSTIGGAGSGTGTQGNGGAITISDPALLGADIAISSGTGNIDIASVDTGGNMLTVSNTGASVATIAGAITGTGGLTKTDTGTLTLSGANTYTGGTTVDAGTLALTTNDFASAINFSGDALVTAAAEVDITGDVTVTGNDVGTLSIATAETRTISAGIGAADHLLHLVDLTGEGTVTLGRDIYAMTLQSGGSTNITLDDNRHIYGNLTQQAGTSTLTLGANTATVDGDYTLAAGNTLDTTANSKTSYGNIVAAGNASIDSGANVNVRVTGYVANGPLTIVDGNDDGSDVQRVETITDSSPLLTFVQGDSTSDLVLIAASSFNTVSDDPNIQAVGAALDGIMNPTGDMADVLGELQSMTSMEDVVNAEQQLAPVSNSGVMQSTFITAAQTLGTFADHLGLLRTADGAGGTGISSGDETKRQAGWGKAFGGTMTQKFRQGFNGYDATTGGVVMGYDYHVLEGLRLGVGGGWSYTKIDNLGQAGGTNVNSIEGTLYGSFEPESVPLYLDGLFMFGWNIYRGTRNIAFGTINRTAKADYNGQQYSGMLSGGYNIELPAGPTITPLASIEYSRLNINKYTETGADDLNLIVDGQGYNLLQPGVGLKIECPIKTGYGIWTPDIHGKWLYDVVGDKMQQTSTFTGGGPAFVTTGAAPDQNTWNAGVGISLLSKDDWSIIGEFDYEGKDQFNGFSGSLKGRVQF